MVEAGVEASDLGSAGCEEIGLCDGVVCAVEVETNDVADCSVDLVGTVGECSVDADDDGVDCSVAGYGGA